MARCVNYSVFQPLDLRLNLIREERGLRQNMARICGNALSLDDKSPLEIVETARTRHRFRR